nr:hypothetical protein L203_02993 [Cryptococcus depauperatus CBS 7841]
MSRDTPGTSRTRYSTTPMTEHASTEDQEHGITQAPYRPPEPVIDHPEDDPPPYTPGIIAEPLEYNEIDAERKSELDNVDSWQTNPQEYNFMDLDQSSVMKPQLGPGILPRRCLMVVHDHELVRPCIKQVPSPSKAVVPEPMAEPSKVANTSSSVPLPDTTHLASAEDVYNALPGEGNENEEWYFCSTCWAWIQIKVGRGIPEIQSMEDWESFVVENKVYTDLGIFENARDERRMEWENYNKLLIARSTITEEHHHFHLFLKLVPSLRTVTRLERVSVPKDMNVFPHLTFGVDSEPSWETFQVPYSSTKLFMSDSSDAWIMVNEGMVPGQIPVGLANAFTQEKMNNPNPGLGIHDSVNEAWTLLATLLMNPLFKGQRGFVNLGNARFQSKIGANLTSSHILYQIGFACLQEPDGLRVGPFKANEGIEEEKRMMERMNKYMLRTWVEISLYLSAYQKRNEMKTITSPYIDAVSLELSIDHIMDCSKYPKASTPFPDSIRDAIHTLGASRYDTLGTIEVAYDLQITFDTRNIPKYLGALEKITEVNVFGKSSLEMKVAMEKSMDKYTESACRRDVNRAYDLIGYTLSHAKEICVPPQDAPDEYILNMHKNAIQACTSPSQRLEINQALVLIGKERGNDEIKAMGEKGQTVVSVEEAYEALSAPRDAVDDGLMMQYEMAINEYPGKADHYRMCLSVIANAPGEERPSIKHFLVTGTREPEAPVRKDVPVGLYNIGNTCYLNSILQYLYAIKPLREAVLCFDREKVKPTSLAQPDVERAQRFVEQLRLLFLQLYKSELSAVRPEEELAYLAVTRPEVDAIVESDDCGPNLSVAPPPEFTKTKPLLETVSSIPDLTIMPSPSSTAFPSVTQSPAQEILDLSMSSKSVIDDNNQDVRDQVHGAISPDTTSSRSRETSTTSILGKRANNERDRENSRSPGEERVRLKSESSGLGLEDIMEIDNNRTILNEGAESPSTITAVEMSHLELKSPHPEEKKGEIRVDKQSPDKAEAMVLGEHTNRENGTAFSIAEIPPPLPFRPRPNPAKKETLLSGLRFGLQQDSAEVLINVLSQLELALDLPCYEANEKEPNLIKRLFSCKFKQQIVYESPTISPGGTVASAYEAQQPVESVFTHPIIGVEEEGKDLYDCLAELYLKGADIEYEGKKGYMMELMDHFPPMLYIQMRRSQYDPATGRESKTNTHISFPQILSMSRFLLSAPAEKREESITLTREMTHVRTRLHALMNHQPLSIPQTLRHASAGLRELAMPDLVMLDLQSVVMPDLLDALNEEASEVDKEIEELQQSLPRLKARMNEIWKEEQENDEDCVYELVSVFMHRGRTSGSGHYWTYQAHLPEQSDEFYSYNDEKVAVVPASEVLQDRTGSDANPALLCYARKGWNLIESLHREVLERTTEDNMLITFD